MKKVIAVIGMGRSGTSVIARALKALGIDLGNNPMAASESTNHRGFWEDLEVVYGINERLIESLQRHWWTLGLIDPALLTHKTELLQSASDLVQQRLMATETWGFKDPRTARLLPFWQAVFNQSGIQDQYIIALRNPLSVAKSVQAIHGFDLEMGCLLWLMHMVPAVNQTLGKKRVVVSYERVLQAPQQELLRMKQGLGIAHEPSASEINSYTNGFIDKEFANFSLSETELRNNPSVPKLCLTAYEWLNRLAKDEITFDDVEFLAAFKQIQQQLENMTSLYQYVESLQEKNNKLNLHIAHLEKQMQMITLNGLLKKPFRLIYRVFAASQK